MRTQKYGAKLRKLVDSAVKAQKERYECKKCGKKKVQRFGYSLWRCRSCNSVFAGGAYSFTTEVGKLAARFIEEYGK